jgi:Fe(3+) dicitrate transport protein
MIRFFTHKTIFISALLFCMFQAASSSAGDQGGAIKGTVRNATTGQNINGASIALKGTRQGTSTNTDGTFTLKNVRTGNHILVISCVGYESSELNIEVGPGNANTIDIILQEGSYTLDDVVIQRISLTGASHRLQDIPGSAHYISESTMQKYDYPDVNRILYMVPGVNIREEDGFGLRPNIGFRGSGGERSAKITLMEDGVLIAPAPYAAPAAYYFPHVGRMRGLEIRKGSSQIKYGPYTTGGALNLVSTPVPQELEVNTRIIGGNFGYQDLYASVGNTFGKIGIMAEAMNTQSDGFKRLDNGGETGFELNDVILKAKFESDQDAKVRQALTAKVGISTEFSNETYLGLTVRDFERDPYRRYAGSQVDNMQTEQQQYSLRHVIQPTRFMDITTTLYRTNFKRNWYKLDKVKAGDDGEQIGISSILNDPESHADEYNILTGSTSSNADALFVKANNRSYYAQGVESIFGFHLDHGVGESDVEVGLRLHYDQIDRFQWVDSYSMTDGNMGLTGSGTPGTESNRIEDAHAFAGFLQYTFTYNKLTVIPGLRYENILQGRRDYGKSDPERTGADLSTRTNSVDVWIPGIGIEYNLNNAWSTFLGVHKGFSPPGSAEGTLPEKSINYELGTRYDDNDLHIQGVLFFNDYANLLGADLAAAGGSGSGDLFNGGSARTGGLELGIMYNLLKNAKTGLRLPVAFNYTWTNAIFDNNFESSFEPWGTVESGDELPYVPDHMIALNLSLENHHFSLNFNSRYNGAMRTIAGQDVLTAENSLDAYYVMDMSLNVHMGQHITFTGSILNIADAQYAVSDRPAGVRPGLPRSFRVGIKANL